MYGKIFDSIFDSTLVAEGGWLPTYIFMSMVSLSDKDGYVEIAPRVLFNRLGFRGFDSKVSYEEFESALDYLQQADEYSKSVDFEGRRIIPISHLEDVEGARGWWIVNYAKYRDRASREDRAAQSTERSRRYREKQKNTNKNNDETQGDAKGRMQRYTDTDVDIDIKDKHPSDACENSGSFSPAKAKIPYQKITDLYHSILCDPEKGFCLPRIAKLTATRKSNIRQRCLDELKTIDNWKNYFEHVAESKWLTGRVPPKQGRRTFIADIDYLINPSNLVKIAEGKYHDV